jgi:hypothetical protein
MQDFLGFTCDSKWRSAILGAALSFAACHLLALATPPVSLQSELLHFGAVLLRFLLPSACFLAGVAAYINTSRPS